MDYPNNSYIITLIINSDFEFLNFLIPPKIDRISNIEKTMIFVDKVEKNIALRKHLQFLLPNNLKNRGKKIIISFSSILEIKIKTNCLKDFFNNNTKILIYIKAIRIKVNIPDISCVI